MSDGFLVSTLSKWNDEDRKRGVADWPTRIAEASKAVNAWLREGGPALYDALPARQAEKELRAAIEAWEGRGASVRWEYVNAVIAARVNGAFAQVNQPPLKWTDPIRETVEDVTTGVKEIAKPVGFGAGAALVLLGVVYLAFVVRPWK